MQVTRGRFDLGNLDQAREEVGQDLLAALKRLPGYQSYIVGVDRATGRTLSVTVWDTEEHARWSPDQLGDVPSRLRALGLELEPPETFEVVTPT